MKAACHVRRGVSLRSALSIAVALAGAIALTVHAAQGQHSDHVKTEPPGILILAVDDFSQPYVRLFTDKFVQVTSSAPTVPTVYLESLDAVRFEHAGYLEEFRDWQRSKYAGSRIDLIVALGEDALAFLARQRGEPWPNAPALYVEMGSVKVDTRRDLPQASGMILGEYFEPALATVKTILPDTKHVVLVSGTSEVDRGRMGGFASPVRAARLDLEPIEWVGLTVESMVSRAAHLPAQTVVFLLTPSLDAAGRAHAVRQNCERLAAVANVPVFTLGAHDLGCGAVGGLQRDWTLVGRIVAEAALARLAGGLPEVTRVPIERFSTLAFDERQLERWHIPEGRLPAGSTILFREFNLWRDRRSLVITAIIVTLAQALLIVGLVVERRRRQRAELEGRRSLATMAHLDRRAAMGELATSLAHELNQPLNAILQNAGAAQMMLTSASGPPPVDEILDILNDIQSDDARAGEVIRGMSSFLRKQELDVKPLEVNSLAQETVALVLPDAAARGIHVHLELADGLTPIQGDRVHLQQVLLNLLINGMDAVGDLPPDRRRLRVRTAQRNGQVELGVNDRGAGIEPDRLSHIFEAFYTTKGKGLGMGLSIARSIIEAHDGDMGAENNPEGGATVWFRVPAGTES